MASEQLVFTYHIFKVSSALLSYVFEDNLVDWFARNYKKLEALVSVSLLK